MGTPEMACAMWHDENPERGPKCGGHCTAMLWQTPGITTKLGCGFVTPTDGSMKRAVCRYGAGSPLKKRLAANFGSKDGKVAFPDNARAADCKKKWPPAAGRDHTKANTPGPEEMEEGEEARAVGDAGGDRVSV